MGTLQTVSCQEVPKDTRENFVLTGYRPIGIGFTATLKSIYQWHNETLNIWTHLLPIFYFAYLIINQDSMWEHSNVPANLRGPFNFYMYSIIGTFTVSVIAHWFTCMSYRLRNVFFLCDYAALLFHISAVSLQIPVYHEHHIPLLRLRSTHYFIFVYCASVFTVYVMCLTKLSQKKKSNITSSFRIVTMTICIIVLGFPQHAMFTIPYLCYLDLESLPVFAKDMIKEHEFLLESAQSEAPRFWRAIACLLLAGFINAVCIPERWFPRKFDIIGLSHQTFHVLVFFAIRDFYWIQVSGLEGPRPVTEIYDYKKCQMSLNTMITLLLTLVVLVCFMVWKSLASDKIGATDVRNGYKSQTRHNKLD